MLNDANIRAVGLDKGINNNFKKKRNFPKGQVDKLTFTHRGDY